MKATELRIGSHVQLIFPDGEITAVVEGVKRGMIALDVNGRIEWYDSTSINPIPLTEQWLLDLGFKVKREFYEKGKLSILSANLKDYYPNGRVYYNSWAIMESQPKYVHQLQNLYFALTQEELILKERSKE